MALVDYASSSDEEEPYPSPTAQQNNEPVKEKNPQERHRFGVPAPPNTDLNNRNLVQQSSKQVEMVSSQSSELKLPDASLLLNSPSMPSNLVNASEHTSRVAAAMAESAARKRDLNESRASYRRNKVPKGTMPHSKSVPETVSGRLVPPQLAGRANVVTEDISKLFVRKQANSSTE